jgi:VCBS repeat-containing protein
MGSVRRWALLPVLALLIAAMAAVTMPRASARAVSGPVLVKMNYACALKPNGQLRYVGAPAECTPKGKNARGTLVAIVPGPHYVCIHLDGSAFLVASLTDCPVSRNRLALTLPPRTKPVYFCALKLAQLLSYTTDPHRCLPTTHFSVVVPVQVPSQPQPPVLANVESAALKYTAGTPPVWVTASLTVRSPASATLVGATVRISSGFTAGADSLGFTSRNEISGGYKARSGVLTLSGSASVADYQAALRSVKFATSDAAANPAARTVAFTVTDSVDAASAAVSRAIDVTEIAPPVANDDTATTDKNTAVDLSVLDNDTDPAGESLSVASLDTTGTEGAVSVNPDGTIHYDPDGQFAGLIAGQTATDTFTYTATDGSRTSNSATVTVTVTGVSDTPVLSNIETAPLGYQGGSVAAAITGALTVDVADGASMTGATVAIASGFVPTEESLWFTDQNGIFGNYDAGAGVLTLTGTASAADYQTALRSVAYADSNVEANGTREVSFEVSDGAALSNFSRVASRDISVTPVGAPVASDDTAMTDKNTAADINVVDNDTNPAGQPLTVASVDTAGTKGTVAVNPDGTIHYDPDGQFTGLTQGQTATDTFTYTAADGFQTSNSATVTVTINGVNDAPVISDVEITPLSYQEQSPATPITAALTIGDDDDTTVGGATVSITSGLNAADDTLSVANQSGITGSYNANTGVLTLTGAASPAVYQAALRSVKFATSDGSAGPAARTVSFTVTDSLGAVSAAASRTIDVTSPARAPTAVGHSYSAVGNTSLAVGTTPTGPAATVSGSVLNGDSDTDTAATLSVTANTSPAHGTLTMNSDGTFTYLPNARYSGSDSFQYTIAGSNARSLTATATVTVTVGTVVWYVDDAKSAVGNGESGSPFSTLAAATAAAGTNSVIFLYHGGATYTGGVTLQPGEDLFGQPYGLTVGGYSLATAGGSAPVITNSGGDGIDLAQGVDVEGVNVASPSGNGIAASNVNGATVGTSSPVAISGASGDGIHVSGGNGSLNLGRTSVTGSAGHSVSVASRSGGTVTFGGHLTNAGTGVSLTGNGGATIAFTGTLTASTGTHAAFTATGGGTVTATGTGSTLTTTTATAVTVTSTTIGAAGLTFQSVSSNGANPGISLNTTGSSGGLTVTGTGIAGSGGTIQNSSGEGIALSSTSAPSFTDMVIKNNAADGINGSLVTGFTLAGSAVMGNGTEASVTVAEDEDGLNFSPNGDGSLDGLTGAVSITNSTITGSADNNAIISDTSGTLNLTITGTTFSTNDVNTGNDGLHVDANGTTNATVSVTGSTFTNDIGDAFAFEGLTGATGTNSVTFSSNVLSSTSDAVLGGGVDISPYGDSHTAITVNSNNIQNPVGNGIGVDQDGTTGTLTGTIASNVIGTPGTADSGGGVGIGITAEDSAAETLSIVNNDLYQYNNVAGIYFFDEEGTSSMKLTITGNLIANPGDYGSWGIYGVDEGLVCAVISGNSIHNSGIVGQGGYDIELDQNDLSTIMLPGYTGGTEDYDAVQAFLETNNKVNGTPTATAFPAGTGGGFVGGASC